ncbi:MAG: hypothetical protein U0X20_00190 [Caldilineaceae bacterium]
MGGIALRLGWTVDTGIVGSLAAFRQLCWLAIFVRRELLFVLPGCSRMITCGDRIGPVTWARLHAPAQYPRPPLLHSHADHPQGMDCHEDGQLQ